MKFECPECKNLRFKDILIRDRKDSAWTDWIALVNFIQFLYTEEIITEKTSEEMFDHLMGLKCIIDKEDER